MKALVLTGGTGSRLRPLTNSLPKQLIPVANRPVLDHVVEDLKNAGIDEIGFILGNHNEDKIQEHVGDGSRYDIEATYIKQGKPLGLAHAVGCARDFVGNEAFAVYFGDTIIETEITEKLIEGFDPEKDAAGLCLQEVDNPSRFGIADFDQNGNLVRMLEKPDDPPTDLAYIGVQVFSPEIFEQIENLEPSWRGELELTQAIDGLVREKDNIHWFVQDGIWRDVGTPTDVVETNTILLDRAEKSETGIINSSQEDANLSQEAEIGEDVTIIPPVSIEKGTTIEGESSIGPYVSIGENCAMSDVEVESSVILGDTEIDGIQLNDSVIGRSATITSSKTRESTYIVGKNSELQI